MTQKKKKSADGKNFFLPKIENMEPKDDFGCRSVPPIVAKSTTIHGGGSDGHNEGGGALWVAEFYEHHKMFYEHHDVL